MGPKTNDWCPHKKRRGQGETQGRRPCGGGDGGRSDAATVRECQESPETGGGKEIFFPRGLEGSRASLTLRFWTSKLQNCDRINFYNFKSPSYGSPRKLIQRAMCLHQLST